MDCIDISEAKSESPREGLALRIYFRQENLLRFPIEILYYYEQGFRTYILEFSPEHLSLSYIKLCEKIRENVYRLLSHYDLKIYLKGFPPCIFERFILPAQFREDFQTRLILLDTDTEKKRQSETCSFCSRSSSCLGFFETYANSFGEKEFLPFFSHENYVEVYKKKLSLYQSQEIKENANLLLDDFFKEKEFERKSFFFVRCFSSQNDDEAVNEKISYQILMRKKDLAESFSFISSFYKDDLDLSFLNPFLPSIVIFTLHFSLFTSGELRKALSFEVKELSQDFLDVLSEKFSLSFDELQLATLFEIEIKGEELLFSVSQRKEEITTRELKDFLIEYPLESKKRFLNVLHSRTKNLKGTYLRKNLMGVNF